MLFTLLLTIIIEINGVFSTTCSDESECDGDTITDKAFCYGYKACQHATIDGTYAYCHGYYGCRYATEITTSEGSASCRGDQSCREATSISAATSAYCDGYYGCAYISNKVEAVLNVYCDGDYGCRSNSIESGTDTYCDGNYACYYATIDAGDDIFCDGDYSCAYSTLNAADNAYCYGKYGCRNAEITTVDRLYAYGFGGAYYATIKSERVDAFGYYSIAYADLDSDDELAMDVYCYGYRGGYGASFTCRSGSTCKLYCKGDCCNNMDFICLNGSSCTTDCSDDGVDCPDESTSLSKEDDIKLLKYLEHRKIKQKNNKIHKDFEAEFKRDEEKLKQKYEEIENNMKDETGSLLSSFNGDSMILSSGRYINDSLLVITAIMVFVVAFIINYCYFNIKYKNYQYKPLN